MARHTSTLTATRLAMALTAVGLISACGGGGGGGPVSLSGKVIDGYIKGAKVCLDLNANLACDPGEPSTTSGDGGDYTLPPYSGSIDGLQVVAEVPVGATDSELGVIQKPFDLMAPAEAASAVTPLTTLVANEMTTKKVSAADAEKAVTAELNLPATQKMLGVDVTKDAELLKVATVVAASMASTKETLRTLNDQQTLGLDKAAIVKAAINEVRTAVLPQVISTEGKAVVETKGKTQEEVVAAVAAKAEVTTQLTGKVQQIVAQSKTGDSTVLNMEQGFKNGFFFVTLATGDYLDNSGKRIDGSFSGYKDRVRPSFIKYDPAIDSAPKEISKVWLLNGVNGKGWYQVYEDSEREVSYVFAGSDWVQRTGDSFTSTKPIFKDNCFIIPVAAGITEGQKICGITKDLSGKKLSDFLKDSEGKSLVCKSFYTRGAVDQCDPEQTFPSDAGAIELTLSSTTDIYEIWTGSEDWAGYNYDGFNWNAPAATVPTIAKFITALQKEPQWTGSGCSVGFKVKSLAADGKSGVMEWGGNSNKNGCFGAFVNSFEETTNFKVDLVGGREVLRVPLPNLYRKLNPGDLGYSEQIFSVVEKEIIRSDLGTEKIKIKGIFGGEFSRANSAYTLPFTGNLLAGPLLAGTKVIDAIFKARGADPFPYK